MSRPRVSVVVPTYERRELVLKALAALDAQQFGQPFEIIVVVDGSTDGTAGAVRARQGAHPVWVIEQSNRGAAAARNAGACAATGEILLFLDDDMEAHPDLLAEHDASHRAGADAVLGHMPLHPDSPSNALSRGVKAWTDDRLARLAAPGAPLTDHDMLTGQISVRTDLFHRLGRFDDRFTSEGSFGDEDVDFGRRLLDAGCTVRFNPRAISAQRYVITPEHYLRQWRETGSADVQLARKHGPGAHDVFRLNGRDTRFAHFVARPLAKLPERLALVPVLERRFARAIRRDASSAERRVEQARSIAYWRGVAEAGGMPRLGRITVLAYHAIDDLPLGHPLHRYAIPLDRFRRQLRLLRRAGLRLAHPRDLHAFTESCAPLPQRSVLVTFDDCYRTIEPAAAALSDLGGGAVAFAVTGQIGGTNAWDERYGPTLPLLDEAGLHRLSKHGVEVGAHSRTHPQLPDCDVDTIREEVSGSLSDLEAIGLDRPRLFAYPYGEHDARTRAAVAAAGVRVAFTVDPGVVEAGCDLTRAPRVEVYRTDSAARLLAKVVFARQMGRVRRARAMVRDRLRRGPS